MRRKASQMWEIVTQHDQGPLNDQGPLMWYDGRKFSNNGRAKTYSFSRASKKAQSLMKRFPILVEKGYRLWLRKYTPRTHRKNPESLGLKQSAHKLEEFTGHKATTVIEAKHPVVKEGLVIGELKAVVYDAKRDGIDGDRMLSYEHKFRKQSRPLLATNANGNQLLIVGGRYEFTEAGIEDR